MGDTQHFCLRWNNYQSSITSAFENLRDDEDFVDVTLACDGNSLKAHRVVLSACSPYFRELLKSTPCKHPVIVLQDVAFTDLQALVEFIYHGEVNVHQRSLSSFLKTAEVLRVSGLTHNENAQGTLLQPFRAPSTTSPHTPPHSLNSQIPHTPTYDRLEEALLQPSPSVPLLGRVPRPPRRISRSADNSPDVIKRPRHDNNNDQPQIHATDFSITNKNHNSRSHNDAGNNGNGISNSSSSPSPRLIDDVVKNEPLDMICTSNTDVDRSTDDTPPHSHHRQLGGPPSHGSSGDAEECTPPPHVTGPFIPPPDTKLFTPTNSYNFSMDALHPSLAASVVAAGLSRRFSLDFRTLQRVQNVGECLQNPLTPDGMASTSQVGPLGAGHRCEVCGKLLSTRLTLKRHTEQQHLQPLHSARCSLCHKVFRTLNSLNNHKSIYHRRQRAPPALHQPENLSTAPDAKHSIDFYKFKDQFNV